MIFRHLIAISAIALSCALVGCSSTDPFFPSLAGPFGADPAMAEIPVGTVAENIRCELADFVSDNNWLLDPKENASLSLKFETDHAGKATWVGIDLSKLGPLAPLSTIISATNKVPSLQASGQAKTGITTQIDFNVSQNPKRSTGCKSYERKFLTRYYLREWLNDFAKTLTKKNSTDSDTLCMTKITLNTGFTIVVDVSGGLTPIAPSGIIIPVSGFNFDYSPTFVHTLNIAFTVGHDQTHASQVQKDLCKSKGTEPNLNLH